MDMEQEVSSDVSPELQTKLDELLALVSSQGDIDAIRTALNEEEKELGEPEEEEESPEQEDKKHFPSSKKPPVEEFTDEDMPK